MFKKKKNCVIYEIKDLPMSNVPKIFGLTPILECALNCDIFGSEVVIKIKDYFKN